MQRHLLWHVYNNISDKFATSFFSVVTLKTVAAVLLELSLLIYKST